MSLRSLERASALALCLVVGATAVHAAPTPKRRARTAIAYLAAQQADDGSYLGSSGFTADAVVGMVAARRGPRSIARALSYLEANLDGISLGEKSKTVMAVVAASGDPRDFGGRDLVQEILDSQGSDGRYATAEGDTSGKVISHALAMLALHAAGVTPDARAGAWLASAQCADGGWQYDEPASESDDEHCFGGAPGEFARSDTNTASYAVQALRATPEDEDLRADPFAFFRSARDPVRRGWVLDPTTRCDAGASPPECSVTDANSTGLVIQAYAAYERAVPAGGARALARLQYGLCGKSGGAFAYTWERRGGRLRRFPSRSAAADGDASAVIATIGAVPGLLRKPLPVAPAEVRTRPPSRAC